MMSLLMTSQIRLRFLEGQEKQMNIFLNCTSSTHIHIGESIFNISETTNKTQLQFKNIY